MAASSRNTRKANARVRFLNSASMSALRFCLMGRGVPVVASPAAGELGPLLSITALIDDVPRQPDGYTAGAALAPKGAGTAPANLANQRRPPTSRPAGHRCP